MCDYRVIVKVSGTSSIPIDTSDELLEAVYEALLEHDDLLGIVVGADSKPTRIIVTATISASNQDAAVDRLVDSVGDVLVNLDLIQGFVAAATSYLPA